MKKQLLFILLLTACAFLTVGVQTVSAEELSAAAFADNTHQLKVIHGDRGTIAIEVKHGKKQTVTINKDRGYDIDKVEYNGKDVTADVNDKDEYTTPAIEADATLKITFKKKE